MNRIALILLLLALQMGCMETNRAESAKEDNWHTLSSAMRAIGLTVKPLYVYIRCFKQEELVQAWVSNHPTQNYKLIRNYSFCTNSGTLGPKRKEGDHQIPEGLYYVDRFNPKSNFHLSMGINYPNDNDLIHGDQSQPGSDIFIHGECSSVGCIALGNKFIRELYTLAKEAHDQGQPVRVDIFPYKFGIQDSTIGNSEYDEHRELWNQLLPFCTTFEQEYVLQEFEMTEDGKYQLAK